MNGKYDIDRDLFFEIDGLTAHDKQQLSSSSDGRPFGHNRHGPKIGRGHAPFRGEWAPI